MRRGAGLLVTLATAVIAVAAVGAVALAWRPAIAPIDPVQGAALDRSLVARGEALAALGNCAACHTTSGGYSYAGGVPVHTPFGTIYGTNVTPDPETGIGRWSEAAFVRAMREGVDRAGRHLYPAFPYTHFTRLSDADLQALYAYLMSRDPVRAVAPANDLVFPLQFRPLLAGWKLMFLERSAHVADASRSPEWNRGAYLVDALAHCGACHTPRNALGGEKRDERFSGGESGGWHAPALNALSPSPSPWTADELVQYLRTGLVENHAIAAGPMLDVVRNLSNAPEADVRAIARFVESSLATAEGARQAREQAARKRAEQGLLAVAPGDDRTHALGEEVYAGACASCHEIGRGESSAAALKLPLAIAVHNPDPRNLVRIVIEGIAPPEESPGRWMPPFGGILTDEQIVALAAFLRHAAAGAAPWPDVANEVKKARAAS